jgi:hypothetical protein
MKRLMTAGGIALASLATLSAIAAGSASAEVPELGRCVKVEGTVVGKKTLYGGGYTNKSCIKSSPTKKGKYEFLPGPGAEDHFYGIGEEPEPILETVGGKQIECAEMVVKGEYTGPKTEKAEVSFGGCQTGTEPIRFCQTDPAKEGVIEATGSFEGELGVIRAGAKPTVGWDLKREGVAFVFECGVPPQGLTAETIEGSVIGELHRGFFGSDINKMSLYSQLRYRAVKGVQTPEAFEGKAKEVLSSKIVEGLTTSTEQTGLTTTQENVSGLGEPNENPANREPLEVKTFTK